MESQRVRLSDWMTANKVSSFVVYLEPCFSPLFWQPCSSSVCRFWSLNAPKCRAEVIWSLPRCKKVDTCLVETGPGLTRLLSGVDHGAVPTVWWAQGQWLTNIYILTESVKVAVAQSRPTHGRWPTRLLRPWDSPGKNAGVGCHALLQRICPNQGSNSGLHCRQILYHLSHQGSLIK